MFWLDLERGEDVFVTINTRTCRKKEILTLENACRGSKLIRSLVHLRLRQKSESVRSSAHDWPLPTIFSKFPKFYSTLHNFLPFSQFLLYVRKFLLCLGLWYDVQLAYCLTCLYFLTFSPRHKQRQNACKSEPKRRSLHSPGMLSKVSDMIRWLLRSVSPFTRIEILSNRH